MGSTRFAYITYNQHVTEHARPINKIWIWIPYQVGYDGIPGTV